MEIRTLIPVDFRILHQAFVEAFSDYVAPMQPTEDQLREMFTRRGVDLAISAGAFADRKLVGFTFNAIDDYGNVRTAYDAGSAVLPAHRRKGIANAIFHFLLPKLKQAGARQYLLEVIEQNTPAVRLYEKIGFRISRKFDVFVGRVKATAIPELPLESHPIPSDWESWRENWNWEPSWQNSSASIQRSRTEKLTQGVFLNKRCIGYGIVDPGSGDVPQFCIHRDFRRKGAGRFLMQTLQELASQDLRLINMESSSEPTIRLIESCGIPKFGSQFEMRMQL